MKANRAARHIAHFLLAGLVLATAACSGKREAAPAPAAPKASPSAQPSSPPPSPAPRAADWRDMPASPGTWRWRMEGSRSVARFGSDDLVLSCERASRTVTVTRLGQAQGQVPMTILTAATRRTLSAEAIAGPPAAIASGLPANDSLLDAMAFSRGRFAVEVPELPTLYLPSWPEVSRVIEDCR